MELIRREGVFRLFDRQRTLILTDEKQLERIAYHPDEPLFKDESYGHGAVQKSLYDPETTLDSFMREAKESGCDRVEVSYDFFFGGSKRENYPDSPLTVQAFKVVCDYAKRYGMQFGASLISPLDLCGAGAHVSNKPGRTWQMQEGAIENGRFRIRTRRQMQWYNNKGPVALKLNRVLAVAFDEERIEGTSLFYVDENRIEDISECVSYKLLPDTYKLTNAGYAYDEIEIEGMPKTDKKRVLAVIEYETPEIDYFEDRALDYVKGVIDLHAENGISYGGFYSDEMHIQFDWDLQTHFGRTEIRTRYMTDSFARAYAAKYGEKYRDFLKYMVYFAYGQHGGLDDISQHVFGKTADKVLDTWLFRKRYFEMLSERVVGIACDAKAYAESLFGSPIMTRAHSTWQEGPTCDHWFDQARFERGKGLPDTRYDYAETYDWGASIRENMSACYDYFRWNEFLSGAGTDHAEGGFSDRDYYSQAFAASLGSLNKFEKAYAASWGCPKEIIRRFYDVGATYAGGCDGHGFAQGMRHRDSDVLLLYPTELNYPEERYGTWMTQYGYGNYITEEKLLKYGRATDDGRIEVNGRFYRALVSQYEIFVSPETFDMLEKFLQGGGKLLWTSAPALRYEDGGDCEARFKALFGIDAVVSAAFPRKMPGATLTFEGSLSSVSPMTIPSDLFPDGVYPVVPGAGEIVARAGGAIVGCRKGNAVYLGARVRDDQSRSTGADVAALYEVLCALGAYGPDSLEARSRDPEARYILNRFPNGAVSVANHYRTFAESGWKGGFFRDEADDARSLTGRELPPVEIALSNERILGHAVTYAGEDALTYRYDGILRAFCGRKTKGIEIDGQQFALADREADICFAEIEDRFRAPGISRLVLAKADDVCRLRVPALFAPARALLCERDWRAAETSVPFTLRDGYVEIDVTEDRKDHWIALLI